MTDNIQNAIEHMLSSMLAGDYDEVLTTCEDLERRRGYYWGFDFMRSQVFLRQNHWRASEQALTKVSRHVCGSPLCLSKTASIYLGSAAHEQGKHLQALGYLNRYLREFRDDIMVLALRAEVWVGQWKQTEAPCDLRRAIGDHQKAYKLLGTLPDNQVYGCKILRLIAADHSGEIVNRCQHVIDAGIIRQFLNRAAPEPAALEPAETLLGGIMSADSVRMDIGILLVRLLVEDDDVRPEDILAFLREDLLPICQNNSDAFYEHQAIVLYMISGIHLEIHEDQLDKNNMRNLVDAKGAFDELLRLHARYPLDDWEQEIDTLETAIDQNRN